MEEKDIKVRPFFIKCMVVEGITIVLILLTVLTIKYTNQKLFTKIKKWYEKNILDETSISEIVEEGGSYEI